MEIAVGFRQLIDFVEDHEGRFLYGINLVQHLIDRFNLLGGNGIGGVDHVHENICLNYFFEGGFEGLDELMRQLADEADGVTEQRVLVGGQAQAAGGGVKRGKEFVLGQHLGAG